MGNDLLPQDISLQEYDEIKDHATCAFRCDGNVFAMVLYQEAGVCLL